MAVLKGFADLTQHIIGNRNFPSGILRYRSVRLDITREVWVVPGIDKAFAQVTGSARETSGSTGASKVSVTEAVMTQRHWLSDSNDFCRRCSKV